MAATDSRAGAAISSRTRQRRKILAVSSGGGHWVELIRLVPALGSHEVVFATVDPAYRSDVGSARFYRFSDATRWNRWRIVRSLAELAWIVVKERPAVVISTGALPGYLAVRLAKALGARTIWVDSIANVDELSLSGQKAGRYADLWLTQWPHLASPDGPRYCGTVL